MRRAESDLEADRAKRAAQNMQLALETIRQATRDATAMAERSDFQALIQKFMAFRTRLEEIREQQSELRDGASALVKRVTEESRLTRADARRATRLARIQGTIHERTEATRAKIEGAVYQWALSRIADHMMLSQQALTHRQIDHQLTATHDRILRDLDQLLLAFEQIAALPPLEMNVDSTGGGGRQSQQTQQPSVPTAAELLVLKAVQQELNARTQTLAKNIDLDRATEQQLEQVRSIGLEQRELHALTQRITRRYQKVQD
jgi:hypothetical protein